MHQPKERGGRGLPAKVVQDLLGHSSITMTLDTYGHLFPRGYDRAELAKASHLLLARSSVKERFLLTAWCLRSKARWRGNRRDDLS